MPPKRPLDGGDNISGRDRKKQKMAAARTIPVQSAEAGPGPSSMARLPNVIDVERFVDSRRFEIGAMQDAMQTASASSTHRAWQTLPRHLRRRAASHDVRRVPVRLRQKAAAEMDIKKTSSKHKAKRGKTKQISRTDELLKRQRDKSWLETHVWHAKRMKMITKWGYRLALHPSEKSFRPSHRAAVHGSILHDASYQSLIELTGKLNVLGLILNNCCDPMSPLPAHSRFTIGARTTQLLFYKPNRYPFDLIAPVTIMWRPLAAQPAVDLVEAPSKSKANENPALERTVWIRAHPAVHDQIFDALHDSASSVLDSFKKGSASDIPVEVEIVDMRGKINIFEIMGPKTSQVLKGALQPVEDSREEFKKFWEYLRDLPSAGSVPRGMVAGFTVHDPRLKFPPQNAKPSDNPSPYFPYPAASLAQSDIWKESERRRPKFKKKDLDERRAKNLVPGTKLQALRQDDRIPVLLIQRSLEPTSKTDQKSSSSESLHGWTVIVPAGWSMAFFSSLTFTGTRVGGQRECQTQAFEAGVPHFPRDHPFTDAYSEYVEETEQEAKDLWERKPPAKRPNFVKLLTRSPWKPDWNVVLGTEKEKPLEEFLSTQREEVQEELAPDNSETEPVTPWLLCGPALKILSSSDDISNSSALLLSDINSSRLKRGLLPLMGTKPDALLQGALVHVEIKMVKRGCPEDNAMLHMMSDDEVVAWKTESGKTAVEASLDVDFDDEKKKVIIPATSTIVGYVTTGHFSLMRGEAHAIGCLPLTKYLELKEQSKRTTSPAVLIRVRNPSEDLCRVASIVLM